MLILRLMLLPCPESSVVLPDPAGLYREKKVRERKTSPWLGRIFLVRDRLGNLMHTKLWAPMRC